MFAKGIAPDTGRSLALLGKIPLIRKKNFFLAGGTAVALRFGHRLSYDLDFFTRDDFDQTKLANEIKKQGNFKIDEILPLTLLGEFEKTKVSFFRYDYSLIDQTEDYLGIQIAGEKDLMAMKIDAIGSRGKKRDFIDLYFLCQKNGFPQAFSCYHEKYKNHDVNFLHALRSLNFFLDAEDTAEDKPHMLISYDWEKVKMFFLSAVPKVVDEEIGKTS